MDARSATPCGGTSERLSRDDDRFPESDMVPRVHVKGTTTRGPDNDSEKKRKKKVGKSTVRQDADR